MNVAVPYYDGRLLHIKNWNKYVKKEFIIRPKNVGGEKALPSYPVYPYLNA